LDRLRRRRGLGYRRRVRRDDPPHRSLHPVLAGGRGRDGCGGCELGHRRRLSRLELSDLLGGERTGRPGLFRSGLHGRQGRRGRCRERSRLGGNVGLDRDLRLGHDLRLGRGLRLGRQAGLVGVQRFVEALPGAEAREEFSSLCRGASGAPVLRGIAGASAGRIGFGLRRDSLGFGPGLDRLGLDRELPGLRPDRLGLGHERLGVGPGRNRFGIGDGRDVERLGFGPRQDDLGFSSGNDHLGFGLRRHGLRFVQSGRYSLGFDLGLGRDRLGFSLRCDQLGFSLGPCRLRLGFVDGAGSGLGDRSLRLGLGLDGLPVGGRLVVRSRPHRSDAERREPLGDLVGVELGLGPAGGFGRVGPRVQTVRRVDGPELRCRPLTISGKRAVAVRAVEGNLRQRDRKRLVTQLRCAGQAAALAVVPAVRARVLPT